MEGGENGMGPDPCEIGPIDLSGLDFEVMENIHYFSLVQYRLCGDLDMIHKAVTGSGPSPGSCSGPLLTKDVVVHSSL